MFLTSDELILLTGKKYRAAQLRALRFMGIEHKIRPDRSIAVLKSHVEKVLDGIPVKGIIKTEEPYWGV